MWEGPLVKEEGGDPPGGRDGVHRNIPSRGGGKVRGRIRRKTRGGRSLLRETGMRGRAAETGKDRPNVRSGNCGCAISTERSAVRWTPHTMQSNVSCLSLKGTSKRIPEAEDNSFGVLQVEEERHSKEQMK